MFGYRSKLTFDNIRDGSSNTAMLSERQFCMNRFLIGQGMARHGSGGFNLNGCAAGHQSPAACYTALDPNNPRKYGSSTNPLTYSGSNWAEGRMAKAGFATVIAPNGPSCACAAEHHTMVVTPSSYHPGGVSLAMGDASVTFITDNIDAGDPTKNTVTAGASPYGVWGSLGSKDGGEPPPAF